MIHDDKSCNVFAHACIFQILDIYVHVSCKILNILCDTTGKDNMYVTCKG